MKKCVSLFVLLCMIGTIGCSKNVATSSQDNMSASSADINESSVISQEQDENSEESITTESSQSDISNDYSENSQSEISTDDSQTEESGDAMGYECKLIVNGNDISEGNHVKMYSNYVHIPFVAVMETLGAEFRWESDSIAQMEFQEMTFILDVDKCELVLEGYDINYFGALGGSRPHIHESMEKELLIDSVEVRFFFQLVGITIEYGWANRTVTINSSPNPPPPIEPLW